ncbi:MAG: peptidylprolyl isomerase [Nitrospira sp.]|nr:peptidylprolyl isomerase [bacterium]MBL7050409.1 peptidylprolyl isomerase [Nitrospira sp.]
MVSADWKTDKEKDIGEALGIEDKKKKKTRTREEAMALAKDLLERIKGGEDFAAIAYEFSDDPYRVKGGDIGYIHRGMFIPELEPLAFDMEIGEIMGPLETEHGVYIIKVEDRKSGQQFSFDEVRDKINNELTEERKTIRLKEWLEALREKAGIEFLQP